MLLFRRFLGALIVAIGGSALAAHPPTPSCSDLLAGADRASNASRLRWVDIERTLDRTAPPGVDEIPGLRSQMLRAPLPDAADRLALEKLSARVGQWIDESDPGRTPTETDLQRLCDPIEFHLAFDAPFDDPMVFDRLYLGFSGIMPAEDPLLLFRRDAFVERLRNFGDGQALSDRVWAMFEELLWHRLYNPESSDPQQREADTLADVAFLEPIAAWAGTPRSPNHARAIRFLIAYGEEAPVTPETWQPLVLPVVVEGLQSYRRLPVTDQDPAVTEAVNRLFAEP